jgi:uncharacterized protein (UPF0261 family)/ABC-type branched-subunit amino acid transport system ATPase component
MAFWSRKKESNDSGAVLAISGLNVYYGRAHALQDVSLTLETGVFGIVGRNGMGKTTLCNAIVGLVPSSGNIQLRGQEIRGLPANEITKRGIAYVPQGRRVWPSLTVDETLKLVASDKREVERVYTMFPRLAERKSNGGSQLSGGEQQMLAIGRALLLDPKLLVMDEPTEGLAPVIVDQVAKALRALATEGKISVLLIEQNLGVALEVADRVGVMVNGRIAQELPAATLAADRELQERLLGVRSSGESESTTAEATAESSQPAATPQRVFTVKRTFSDGTPPLRDAHSLAPAAVNRWSATSASAPITEAIETPETRATGTPNAASAPSVLPFRVATSSGRAAYVVGTFDTKAKELFYLRQCLEKLGLRVVTVDISTSGKTSPASVHPREIARHHPGGEASVFTNDRGSSVAAMADALQHFIRTRRDLGGIISAGGSGGTSMATPAMRALPIGVPKVMVSTMASGDTRPYVGPSDICMMYSVTDVQGINRISEKVLANAAHALAGMIAHPPAAEAITRPALGVTMFGVTTPCVQALTKLLQDDYDCLVFHATGVGGQSMEKLAESALLEGVIDVTTTEIADEIVGGVLSAGATRLDVFAQIDIPYVGSCGALDMVNFGGMETVPERYKQRKLYAHNPTVTLMRTTSAECQLIGEFVAKKLNAMRGPVRFLIPEGGVSAIDKPGGGFHDPAADRVLFEAIATSFRPSGNKKLIRTPHHINDDAFVAELAKAWHEIAPAKERSTKRA